MAVFTIQLFRNSLLGQPVRVCSFGMYLCYGCNHLGPVNHSGGNLIQGCVLGTCYIPRAISLATHHRAPHSC